MHIEILEINIGIWEYTQFCYSTHWNVFLLLLLLEYGRKLEQERYLMLHHILHQFTERIQSLPLDLHYKRVSGKEINHSHPTPQPPSLGNLSFLALSTH